MKNNYDKLAEEVLSSRIARSAAKENRIRRELAAELEAAMKARGLSIRSLAKEMNSSVSQVQRLLHREVGGSLTLRTIVRAADVLNVNFDFYYKCSG